MSNIVPINQLGSRMAEHGRIRFGVKTKSSGGKERPTSIDTMRFTSPDKTAIEQLAALYGGTAKPWSDPKASPQHQFEVISTVRSIPVWVPGGMLSQNYELWSGGGAERVCDGEQCETSQRSYDADYEPVMVPCICDRKQRLECKLYTRMSVVIPTIRFGGVWRVETKGRHAGEEMPAMADMIDQLQATGILTCVLSMEMRQTRGGGRKFVVPTLSIEATAAELSAGTAGTVAALGSGASQAPALGPGVSNAPSPVLPGPTATADPWDDDQVVDAELVEDEPRGEVTTEHAARLAHCYDLPNAPRDVIDLEDRQVQALLDGTAKWSASTEGRVVKA